MILVGIVRKWGLLEERKRMNGQSLSNVMPIRLDDFTKKIEKVF